MARIEVHNNVLQVQCLDGVLGERLVGISSVCALRDVQVGHKVGQTVWFDDQNELDVRERLDLSGDVVNVSAVESSTVVGKGKFAIGGQGGAVSLGEIVYDEGKNQVCTSGVLSLDILCKSSNGGNLGANITRWRSA